MLGDSLSAGYGLASGESWVDLLQQRLNAAGYSQQVVNASISGDTTRGGLARLPRALKIHQPEVVIIELGGNDGLRGIPVSEIRHNMDKLVALASQAGADVLVMGIRLPPNYGPVYAEKFRETIREAAETGEAGFVPFVLEDVALEPGMMQSDGIHPTAKAQPIIVDRIWPHIVDSIDAQPAMPAGK